MVEVVTLDRSISKVEKESIGVFLQALEINVVVRAQVEVFVSPGQNFVDLQVKMDYFVQDKLLD